MYNVFVLQKMFKNNEVKKVNLKYVESNKHDLIDVYNYIKEKCKEFGEDGVKNKPRSRKRQNPYF